MSLVIKVSKKKNIDLHFIKTVPELDNNNRIIPVIVLYIVVCKLLISNSDNESIYKDFSWFKNLR